MSDEDPNVPDDQPTYMDLKRKIALLEGQLVRARSERRLAETAARLAQERMLAVERDNEALRNAVPLLRNAATKSTLLAELPRGNLKLSKEKFLLVHQLSQQLHAKPADIGQMVGMSDSVVRSFLDRTYFSGPALAAYQELGVKPKTYDEVVSEREQRGQRGSQKPRRAR